MSETNKTQLSTISYDKGKTKCKKQCETIRFNLSLIESNENSCSEFNYGELLTEHFHKKFAKDRPKKEAINEPELHPKDPFSGRDNEELKALAKEFENKYGTSISGKKKKKITKDFDSLGQGYDESDPFIDNSDALDDVVPKNVDTKFGGFYINAGELDFHEVQCSDDDTEAVKVRRKKRKIIESSDEENKTSKATKLNGFVNDKFEEGEIHRRRKKLINKFNAKKHKLPHSPDENCKVNTPTGVTSIAASIEAVINKMRDSDNFEKEDNDEGVEGDDDEPVREATSTASSSSSSVSSVDGSTSDSESDNEENGDNNIKKADNHVNSLPFSDPNRCSSPEGDEIVPLPNNLPHELASVLDKIKEVGRNSRGSCQKFFTDPAVNKMLLSIEIKLAKLSGSRKKTQIYKHLACHLPCGMQTIVKRAKNLLHEKLEERLKAPMQKLKEAITEVMPALTASYNLECEKVAKKKDETLPDIERLDAEKKPKSGLPKKKFSFTSTIISYLCEVVKVKCQGWNLIKKRNEDPEEHVREFLDENVKPLWPKGWVSAKLLYKLSQQGHSNITNIKPLLSLQVEELPISSTKQSIPSNEKPVLSYESVELPYHLEKLVKTEAAKISPESLATAEVKPQNSEVQVNQHLQKENKVIQDQIPPLGKKTCPDLVAISVKEQIIMPRVENPMKSIKNEESSIKDELLNFALDSTKTNNDVKHLSNYLPKVTNSFDNPDLSERKPPKPSLSATALPKINIISKTSDMKEKRCNTKEEERNTITCITIKSVDKIYDPKHKYIKDLTVKNMKEVTRTVESVSILDLSVGKNMKVEATNKLPTPSVVEKRCDDSNNQVVDLCIKSSPVKNAKLDQEMDKVMNDLLEISRNIQGTPEPSPLAPVLLSPNKDLTSTIPRYPDRSKVERVSNTLESNHSVNTLTTNPIKPYPSEFSEKYKYSKPQSKIETPSIYRQSTTSQDHIYKPKTVFQESYLAQKFPSKVSSHPHMVTSSASMHLAQNSASIKSVTSAAPCKVFTSSNSVTSSINHPSSIQHTNPSKIVSPTKSIAEITIHRPNVNPIQRPGTQLSVKPSDHISRMPSTVTMHQVTSSTHADILSRPNVTNTSQGHHNSSNISVNFNPSHGSMIHSKPHSTNHFPSNHSIQSLSQSSSSHRYDSSIQPKHHSNHGQNDPSLSNRNQNDLPSQKVPPNDPLVNLRHMQGLSVSSVPKKALAHSTTSGARPTNMAISSSHKLADPKGKPSGDNMRKLPLQPAYSSIPVEQMKLLKNSSQHQQEFWKHINASGYFGGISSNDAMKYMKQSGQYTGSGSGSSKQGQY